MTALQLLSSNMVAFELIRNDGTHEPLPAEEVEISTNVVRVKAGETIQSLLIAEGFRPDAGSYGLVYLLNPSLRDLAELRPDSSLALPRVKLDPAAQRAINAGDSVGVILDPELRESFGKNVSAVSPEIALMVTSWSAEQLGGAERADDMRQSLKNISTNLDFIQRGLADSNGVAIPTSALTQLSEETKALHDICSWAAMPGGALSEQDQVFIRATEKDLAIKKDAYSRAAGEQIARRWRKVLVTVNILKNGVDVPSSSKLRVWYVPQHQVGNRDLTRSFPRACSPCEDSLDEAQYIFWAAHDDDRQHTPVTNELSQEISRYRTSRISLTVK